MAVRSAGVSYGVSRKHRLEAACEDRDCPSEVLLPAPSWRRCSYGVLTLLRAYASATRHASRLLDFEASRRSSMIDHADCTDDLVKPSTPGAPGNTARLFIVEHRWQILILDVRGISAGFFLISFKSTRGEGLLGCLPPEVPRTGPSRQYTRRAARASRR